MTLGRIALAAATTTLIICSQLIAADAFAAKDKFETTKPHVNVGT